MNNTETKYIINTSAERRWFIKFWNLTQVLYMFFVIAINITVLVHGITIMDYVYVRSAVFGIYCVIGIVTDCLIVDTPEWEQDSLQLCEVYGKRWRIKKKSFLFWEWFVIILHILSSALFLVLAAFDGPVFFIVVIFILNYGVTHLLCMPNVSRILEKRQVSELNRESEIQLQWYSIECIGLVPTQVQVRVENSESSESESTTSEALNESIPNSKENDEKKPHVQLYGSPVG